VQQREALLRHVVVIRAAAEEEVHDQRAHGTVLNRLRVRIGERRIKQ
jgi:hypothetical protein